ncbi:hypothetical protein N8457_00245 [bacterium]|nr:hypothetical protein [bacterium]
MIDIICCFNDNLSSNWDGQRKAFKRVNNKSLDYSEQFIALYYSIKKNWRFDYTIYLCHSLPISNETYNKLNKLDIKLIEIESPNPENFPYLIRSNSWKLKTKGTHKLYLDADMIALKTPVFDLSKDFLVMPCNNNILINTDVSDNFSKIIDHPIKTWKHENNILNKMWMGQLTSKEYIEQNYFPHINGGAILIKNELSEKFSELWWQIFSKLQPLVDDLRPLLFTDGLTITKMSSNWSIFELGFNFFDSGEMGPQLDSKIFNKDAISLYHYVTDKNLTSRFGEFF